MLLGTNRRRIRVHMFRIMDKLLRFILVRRITMNNFARQTITPSRIMGTICTLGMRNRAFRAMNSLTNGQFALRAAGLLRMDRLHRFRTIRPRFPTRPPNARHQIFPIVFRRASIIGDQIRTRLFREARMRLLGVIQQ